MALPAMRQRIGRLESVFVVDRLAGFPPLTTKEIEALAVRMASGYNWTQQETARVAWRCPYTAGELIIRAPRCGINIKRYPGLDVAAI